MDQEYGENKDQEPERMSEKVWHGQISNILRERLGNQEQGIWPQEKHHDNKPGQQEIVNKQNAETQYISQQCPSMKMLSTSC